MASHHQPPPNVFYMTPPGSQSSRRMSRFTEHPMQEYTPANSVYEEDQEYDDGNGELSNTRVLLRLVSSIVHLTLCTLLLAVMAQFINRTADNFNKLITPEAITLLVLLSLDVVLDIISLARYRKRWQSWALLMRLVYAIGYLSVFMVYVGLGRVFTPGYMYWGMPSGYSGPVVYLFLWIIGVWNLLHTALRRHHLGNGMRHYFAALHALSSSGTSGPRDERAVPVTRRSSRSTTRIARAWGRARRGAGSDLEGRPSTGADSISLRERREEEDEEDKTVSVTTTSSRAKADEAGETGLRSPPPAAVR